jgi:hypothetical protein
MPLLGDVEFPQTDPDRAIAAGRKLAGHFRGETFGVEACASALGYKSSKNGAFRQLLADLRKFGLVSGRGDTLRATELLQRLTVPRSGAEFAEAKDEMMNSVPLFRDLSQTYGPSVPTESDLTAALIQMTEADRLQIRAWVPRIRRILLAGWSGASLPPVVAEAKRPLTPSEEQAPTSGEPPGERATFAAGGVRLEFPLTDVGLQLMRANLEREDFWRALTPRRAVRPAQERSLAAVP